VTFVIELINLILINRFIIIWESTRCFYRQDPQ